MKEFERHPAPWPSIENLSQRYADQSMKALVQLEACVILIQRAWRGQQKYPIVMGRRPVGIRWAARSLQDARRKLRINTDQRKKTDTDSFVIHAYEKLDGTNLSVGCDGAVFGRRSKVKGTSYQRCELEGVIPAVATLQSVKKSLAEFVDVLEWQLYLYGELLCNPGRYGYDKRGMAKKWRCFGAILVPPQCANGDFDKEMVVHETGAVAEVLREQTGFLCTVDTMGGKLRLTMNESLNSLLHANGVECVNFIDKDVSLKTLCKRQQTRMLDNSRQEGYVLSARNILWKWKTGKEDESMGLQKLRELLLLDPRHLDYAGVDVELATLLMQVAGNKPRVSARKENVRKSRVDRESIKGHQILEKAFESAMTKYDDLSVYFAEGETKLIKELLCAEIVADMGADTQEEVKAVQSFVEKQIGQAFGKWKRKDRSDGSK